MIFKDIGFVMSEWHLKHSRPPGEFQEEKKKSFLKRVIFKKKILYKKIYSLRIKPLKYADRLKGTPCDQG